MAGIGPIPDIKIKAKKRFWFVLAMYLAWAIARITGGRGVAAMSRFIGTHGMKFTLVR